MHCVHNVSSHRWHPRWKTQCSKPSSCSNLSGDICQLIPHRSMMRTTRTFSVQSRAVPRLLTRIHMDPSLLLLRIHLGPDMILRVPHPPDAHIKGTTQHAEAIRPFPTSTSFGLKQCPNVRVSRKALVRAAFCSRTAIQFDSSSASSSLIRCRRSHAL